MQWIQAKSLLEFLCFVLKLYNVYQNTVEFIIIGLSHKLLYCLKNYAYFLCDYK